MTASPLLVIGRGSGCGGGQRQGSPVVEGGRDVERVRRGGQFASHEVRLVAHLAQHRRNDLLEGGQQRRVRGRKIVLDLRVQLGEAVVRDHREHVVLHVVVHVPV